MRGFEITHVLRLPLLLAVVLFIAGLIAACAPTSPAPTQPPAKPTDAPKPTAAPAAPQAAAPTPSPKPGTEPPAKADAAQKPEYDERAVADFYRGKTFKIIVGLAAGGGFDTIYRIWGRHAGKHIPGNPTVIVENMTGAGGLIATNHLYNAAPRDGTTMGTMDFFLTVLGYKAGAKGIEFDPSKFNWIGNPGDPSPPVCALRTELGITSFSDFLKSGKELVLGASGKGNIFYAAPRVVEAATGAKIKVIDGYAGNPAVRLAVDNKELDGACWTLASMRTTGPQWFEGDPPPMRIILQSAKSPHPDLPNVELLRSFVTDPNQLKVVDVLEKAVYHTYLAAFPAEVPAERAAALRDAYIKTWNDPAVQEELSRTQFRFSPVSGQETEAVINEFLAMSPDESKRVGELFGLID
jgi:tripartite-type tricarboxylate transporter receptor subunit TctC